MAAYAALVSVMQIIDQLQRHPSPPISLDKQQFQSLTQNITLLQEFLEGYNYSFVDSDEADPLEIRIAHAAYAAKDVIESYIVHNIKFVIGTSHDDELISSGGEDENASSNASSLSSLPELDEDENASSGDELDSEEEINFNEEDVSSGDQAINYGEEINSNEDVSSGDQAINSGKEINSDADVSSGDQVINSGEEMSCIKFYEDVQQVIEEMDLINKVAMEKIREEITVKAQPLRNISGHGGSSFSGKNNFMVGFDDVLLQLMNKLSGGPLSRQVIPIVGMGGIGKTTLARNLYQNAYVKGYFDIRTWVTISQQFNTKEILSQILSGGSGKPSDKSEEKLREELHKYLFGRRYLIILDDMWSIDVWEKIGRYFVDCKNGSRIIVTTRQSYLIPQLTDSSDAFVMNFLDEINSWKLFSKIVFGEESFPLELEEIGQKIVKNCRGLPLSIVVIGGLLAKLHTQDGWEFVEQNLNSIVNLANDEYCRRLLKMSYNQLPVYLKPCFLYLGVFKEDRRIHVPHLIRLWVSEGFLKPIKGKSLEIVAEGYLRELVDRNLVLVHYFGSTGDIAYCKIHDLLRDLCLNEAGFNHMIGHCKMYDLLRDLCLNEAQKKGFNHVIGQHSSQGIHNQCLKDGLYFVNSRYLSIETGWTCELPSSVNVLWNLHALVSHQNYYMTAPVEIWKISQLRHLIIPGGVYLPDPPCTDNVIMEDLQTLKTVCNFKCGEDVVKRIPNIKRLVIRYFPDKGIGANGDYYCLGNLDCLRKLEFLTCFWNNISNDNILQYLSFPHSLKKLTIQSLSTISWEEMLEKIGSLPLLEKLKLAGGWFTTQKWETDEAQFLRLKLLELQWCHGLKYWTTKSSHFPHLVRLHLYGLTELEEIPTEIGEIPTLQSILLFKCSESAVISAKQMMEEQEESQGEVTLRLILL